MEITQVGLIDHMNTVLQATVREAEKEEVETGPCSEVAAEALNDREEGTTTNEIGKAFVDHDRDVGMTGTIIAAIVTKNMKSMILSKDCQI